MCEPSKLTTRPNQVTWVGDCYLNGTEPTPVAMLTASITIDVERV